MGLVRAGRYGERWTHASSAVESWMDVMALGGAACFVALVAISSAPLNGQRTKRVWQRCGPDRLR